MPVHFLTNTLDKWDAADGGDALAVTFFADERPLRGAAGLADWRLCGRLSQLIKKGRISGELRETLMLPPGLRMAWKRVMVFGLGDSDAFDEERYRDHVRHIRSVLSRAGVRTYAIQPPGRAVGLIAARRALELWLAEAGTDGREPDVQIIDSPGAHKEMAEALRTQHRKRPQP